MKTFKTKTTTSTSEYLDKTYCDLCGEQIRYPDRYEKSEVTISLRESEVYPECGSQVLKSVDVCVKCFETVVVPWFESKGAKFQTHESSW